MNEYKVKKSIEEIFSMIDKMPHSAQMVELQNAVSALHSTFPDDLDCDGLPEELSDGDKEYYGELARRRREDVKHLFHALKLDAVNACADDKALYIEQCISPDKSKYFKLTVSYVSVNQYNAAWARSINPSMG